MIGRQVHHEDAAGDDPVVVVELGTPPRRTEPGDADLGAVDE